MSPHSQRNADYTDLSRLADDLQGILPSLRPLAPLRIVGRGFRAFAVETPGGVLLRIGRHPDAHSGFERESRLLPLIAGRLPISIPRPTWRAKPSDRFPYGVIGYDKLPGDPLQPAMLARADIALIARSLGGFLHALHSIPLETITPLGLPGVGAWHDELRRQRDVILPVLASLFTGAERVAIERWWATFLDELRTATYRPTLCHTDLWYEHVLIDERTWAVTGILDFERARIADPALDIATQMHLGEPFAAAVLAAYHLAGAPVEAAFGHRVRRLWEHREFNGLYDALRLSDADEIAGAAAKIRRGPLLAPR